MKMTLEVPDEIAASVDGLARARGVSRETLVADALRVCYPPMSLELRAELDEWQAAAEGDAVKLGL